MYIEKLHNSYLINSYMQQNIVAHPIGVLSKKGIVILTSHLLFELQMSEHITRMDTDNCQDGHSTWRELVKNEEHTLTVH